MKKCTKCKEEKSLELFNRNRKNKDGLSYICKECNKAYCDMNQDKIASYRQKYKEARSYIKNEKLLKKEAIKAAIEEEKAKKKEERLSTKEERYRIRYKKYKEDNKERIAIKNKEYREKNKEKISEQRRLKYHLENHERVMFNKQLRAEKSVATKEERLVKNRERYNTHRSNNLDKVREIERIKKSTRLERDALYKLKVYTGTSICNALSKNGYKKTSTTATILGCTFDEFYSYIEQQFVDGMSWDNRGEWDLDHIIPVSFGKTEEEIIKLNHYSNFRPLWKSDNLSKAAKITEDALNHPIYLEIIMWRFKK